MKNESENLQVFIYAFLEQRFHITRKPNLSWCWKYSFCFIIEIFFFCDQYFAVLPSKPDLNQKLTRKSPQVFTYVLLIASYRTFTRKSLQVTRRSRNIIYKYWDFKYLFFVAYLEFHDKVTTSFHISYSKVFESSWDGHHKFSVFASLSSNKLLKVHNIATAIWQYLFLAGHSKLFNVHEDVRVSRTPPKFSRMLFNTQIISHYKNTFSVWSAISQYHQSIFRININPNQNSRSYCFRLKNCNNCLKSIY